MPPEAFKKDVKNDFSYDIWSLGCCLYQMAVGELPFGSHIEATFENMPKVLLESELRMSSLRYCSNDFKSLLIGLLKYNSNDRLKIDQIKSHPFFKKVEWDTVL